ncbi:MAG TPA: hypothetical protein VGE93_24545 [Bryobacteraceae bacterium]
MGRFLMEHLPRANAVYQANPLDYLEAAAWLGKGEFESAVRTTEMIDAIQSAMDVTLTQSAMPVSTEPGDEALLITLSFGVLLAWAEERMPPLPEDWRCILLKVKGRSSRQRIGAQRSGGDRGGHIRLNQSTWLRGWHFRMRLEL